MGCNLTHTSRNLMEPSKGMELQFTLLGEEVSPLEFLSVLWGTKLTLLQSFDTESGFLNVNLIISLFSCKYFNDIFFFSVCFLKKTTQSMILKIFWSNSTYFFISVTTHPCSEIPVCLTCSSLCLEWSSKIKYD